MMTAAHSLPAIATSDDVSLASARRHCMRLFDPLWKEAWKLPCYREGRNDRGKRQAIQASARLRTRHYLAFRLGLPPGACMPLRLRDLDTLRAFYRACRDVDAQQIRDWWIAMHPPVRLGQLKAGDRVRMRLTAGTAFEAHVIAVESNSVRFQRVTPTGRQGKQFEMAIGNEPERLERVLIESKEAP